MEARIRIATNNKKQPVLSTQDIVSCSNYAQGCEGGFPYLIAGKYGRDFGLVEEDCYPYVGVDEACAPNLLPGCNSTRWRTNQYYYIGPCGSLSGSDVRVISVRVLQPDDTNVNNAKEKRSAVQPEREQLVELQIFSTALRK